MALRLFTRSAGSVSDDERPNDRFLSQGDLQRWYQASATYAPLSGPSHGTHRLLGTYRASRSPTPSRRRSVTTRISNRMQAMTVDLPNATIAGNLAGERQDTCAQALHSRYYRRGGDQDPTAAAVSKEKPSGTVSIILRREAGYPGDHGDRSGFTAAGSTSCARLGQHDSDGFVPTRFLVGSVGADTFFSRRSRKRTPGWPSGQQL
jgi:hypothetical protein